MDFVEYQFEDAMAYQLYANARFFLAETLFLYDRNYHKLHPGKDYKLRSADELIEYRFATDESAMVYHVEEAVLYSTSRYETTTFWRVPLHIDGVLPDFSEVQPSQFLAEMLRGKTEVVPVRIPPEDSGFWIPFEDYREGQMTRDLDHNRAENGVKKAIVVT